MSALPTRSDLSGTPSKSTLQTLLVAIYDVVAQRLAAGTTGAGTASAAELKTARDSLGLGAGADIASAATLDLTARTGNLVRITGTTATSAVTLNNGDQVTCYAVGAWPLTYHATNNPLPGGVDYTCTAGDLVTFSKNGSGTISVAIVRKNGEAVTRQLQQTQSTATGAVATGTTIIPYDDTIPQNTEGDQYLSLAITPNNAASVLEIEVILHCTASLPSFMIAALFQDSGANALSAVTSNPGGVNDMKELIIKHTLTAGSTAATTFKVRAGLDRAGTTTVNGASSARLMGGVLVSRMTIKEYLP